MKRVAGIAFLLVVFALPSFGSASAVRDLGGGLVYLRATAEPDHVGFALPAALASEAQGQSALVVDLRYVAGAEREARRLSEWLNAHAAASPVAPPFFFLVNAETSSALCEMAAQFTQNYPALLIGPMGGDGVSPDVVLAIDPEEERAAYAAIASGETDIAALIGESAAAGKHRYDEAAVIAAHVAPPPDSEPSPRSRRSRSAAAAGSEITETEGNAAIRSPVDLALQRAIHLHRAWRVFEPHPQP